MSKIFKKIKEKKLSSGVIIAFILLASFFVASDRVFAANEATTIGQGLGAVTIGSTGAAVSIVLSIIAFIITAVLGLITTMLVSILVKVAQFNHIIDVDTVKAGWVIVRDICNMFFILILLIIAFGTILRQDNYSAKKLLPKLLVMAVVINFSKTIFGLMIDFSQVVMLTFVSSFKNGGGWFIDMFRVDLWSSINDKAKTLQTYGLSQWSTALAIISGVFAAAITLIVIAVMLAVLVMRIVMLWIYTILSPLVFLGFAFPPIEKYTNQIWTDFIKQLVVGPMLAFFIWLALTTAQDSSKEMRNQITKDMVNNEEVCAGPGAFFCEANFQNFIIVIGLLMGGLMVTQQMGGAISKAASFGDKWSKKGLGGMRTIADWANLKQAGGFKVRMPFTQKGFTVKTGLDFNMSRNFSNIKKNFEDRKRTSLNNSRMAANRNLGYGGAAGAALGWAAPGWAENYISFRGIKNLSTLTTKRGQQAKEGKKRGLDNIEKYKDKGLVIGQQEAKLLETNQYRSVARGIINNPNSTQQEIETARQEDKVLKEQQSSLIRNIESNKKERDDLRNGINTEHFGGKGFTDNQLEQKIAEVQARNSKLTARQRDYRVIRTDSDTDFDNVIGEAKKKVNSDNEEELVEIFDDYKRKGQTFEAAATLEKAIKVGGGNTLLMSQGYNAAKGMTAQEEKEFKDGLKAEGKSEVEIKLAYDAEKGFHDFIRHEMQEGFGLSVHDALHLEARAQGVAESSGTHQYMHKTVSTDKLGNLKQATDEEHQKTLANENSKIEGEKLARNFGRFAYVEEFKDGSAKFTDAGLATLMDKWVAWTKNLEIGRIDNKTVNSIVKGTTGPSQEQWNYNLRLLKKAMMQAYQDGTLSKNSAISGVDEGEAKINKFIGMIINASSSGTKGSGSTFGSVKNAKAQSDN